jgi:hypothetical protein
LTWQRVTGHELLRSLTVPTKRGRRERHESRHGVPGPTGPGTPTPGPEGPPGKRERARGRPGSSRRSHARERSNLRQDTVATRGIPLRDKGGTRGQALGAGWRRATLYCCAHSSPSRCGSAEVHRRDQSESPSRISMPWCVNSRIDPVAPVKVPANWHIVPSVQTPDQGQLHRLRAMPLRSGPSPRDEVAARFTLVDYVPSTDSPPPGAI